MPFPYQGGGGGGVEGRLDQDALQGEVKPEVLQTGAYIFGLIANVVYMCEYHDCSAQTRIGIGHLRKPPGVELIPCLRKPLRRTRTLRNPAQTQV